MLIQLPIPNETWMAVLDCLTRRELAARIELLWDRQFTYICQDNLHEWRKNVALGELETVRVFNETRFCSSRFGFLKMPEVPLPDNVTSFSCIRISYLDTTTMEFLQRIWPLFFLGNSINLDLQTAFLAKEEATKVAQALHYLMPLFAGGPPLASISMQFRMMPFLYDNQSHRPILMNARLLAFYALSSMPREFELLMRWLFTPREEDGQPRLLVLCAYSIPVDGDIVVPIRNRFLDTTREHSSPFIVRMRIDCADVPEESVYTNFRTEEQLLTRLVAHDDNGRIINYVLLIACPLNIINAGGMGISAWLAEGDRERTMLEWKTGEKRARTVWLRKPEMHNAMQGNAQNAISIFDDDDDDDDDDLHVMQVIADVANDQALMNLYGGGNNNNVVAIANQQQDYYQGQQQQQMMPAIAAVLAADEQQQQQQDDDGDDEE